MDHSNLQAAILGPLVAGSSIHPDDLRESGGSCSIGMQARRLSLVTRQDTKLQARYYGVKIGLNRYRANTLKQAYNFHPERLLNHRLYWKQFHIYTQPNRLASFLSGC